MEGASFMETLIRRRSWRIVSAVLALGLIAGACGSDGDDSSSASSSAAVATTAAPAASSSSDDASHGIGLGDGSLGTVEVGAGEDIQIRSLHAISGDVAFLGVPMSRAVDMAVADYGDIHGHSVNVGTWLDDLCSSDGGQAAAQTIVADESVIGVLGTSCSGAATAAAPLITGAGMVLISGSNTSPALTSDLAGTAGSNWSEGYYRTAHNDLYQGAAAAKFAYEVLGASSAATIHDGDPYTEGLATAFANSFSDLGGDLQTITAVNKGDTDMVPVLTEVAAGSPDLLFFPIFPPEGNYISQQIGEVAGLENTTLMAADGMLVDNYMEIPESEGVFMSGPDLNFEGNSNAATGQTGDGFLAAYEAEHGEAPSAAFWAHAYDATTLLLSAIEAASSKDGDTLVVDRAGVREFMSGVSSWPGIIGSITCDDFGDCGSQRIAVVQHMDSSDIAAGKNNVVFTYAPGKSAVTGAIAAAEGMCVGLVTDVGQVDDKSFNQSAWEGVLRAADELGADVDYVETQAAKDYANNIGLFADNGCDVVVTVGFALGEATAIAAAEYPDVDFIGVDQFQGAPVDGVAGLIFPEDQAGFLAGALAASMSQSGIIAEVLGTDLVPPVVAFGEGYVNGAKYVNPDIEVIKTYHPGGIDTAFTDPEWGATTARQALENGADVIFGAGGKTGNGALIEVAGEEGALCIGVDTDQWFTVPEAHPCLITSSMKMITDGVFDLISQSAAGSMPSGNYGGAVGLAPFHDFDSMVSDDIKSMLATLKADLESGAMSACVWDADSNPACSGGDPEPVAGFDGTTIKVGIINDFSGPAAIIGLPLQAGVATYYEWVNDQGGIGGKYPVELVDADSTYNPSVAVQAYNDMKDEIAIVGNLFGTPVTTAVLESLKEDGLMAVPASLDSAWVRESNLIPWGAPYQIQVINGIDWWLNEGGGSTDQVYCSLIQDDPYGEAGQAGLEWIAPKVGITITEVARYVTGDADFSAQIGQLQGAGCEVVWLTALPSAVGGIGGAAAGAGFAPKWIGQSPVWINVFAASALAPYLQENLIIVGEGSTWGDSSMPGAVAMMERMATYAPDQAPDYYFAAGYVMAMASAGALEKAVANGDLSREGILKASTQMSVDFEGLSGEYQYGEVDERQPSTANTIFRVNPDVPNGVEAVVVGYESEYASDYDF